MHITINKIHPRKHTIHNPYRDYFTLGRLCHELEHEFELQRDNHQPRKHGASSAADDMEQHAGIESLLGWMRRECLQQLRGAESWSELHLAMRRNGLLLHERGNGLVITAVDGTSIKASSVDRVMSKGRLEARLGPFAPPAAQTADFESETPIRGYEPQPMRSGFDTAPLFALYRQEQKTVAQTRDDQWAIARERKNHLLVAAKRKGRLKRAAIKLLSCDRWSKRILYAATGKTLLDEIERINQAYLQECRKIRHSQKRSAWADWLCAQACAGSDEALQALRARPSAQDLKGNTLAGQRLRNAARLSGIDGITKHGTVIARAGAAMVRDDGRKLQVPNGLSQDDVQAVLRIALDRYGDCIHVEGSPEFIDQVARAAAAARLPLRFDDPALERRRIELSYPPTKENGHEPESQHRYRPTAAGGVRRGGTPSGEGGAADARHAKPDVGGIGRKPPPDGQYRLRSLSALGMVHFAEGAAMLLPRDVPRHVEQQGAAADHGLRRPVSRVGSAKPKRAGGIKKAGVGGRPPCARTGAPSELSSAGEFRFGERETQLPPAVTPGAIPMREAGSVGGAVFAAPVGHAVEALAAALKYVFEREQRRLSLPDISKHRAYDGYQGPAAFAGLRQIDGQRLALLRQGDDVLVLPIDDATARRLKRLALGDAVTVARGGSINTKGRSR